jgi:FKBP-type peptidyl-prolyl cis-trans isomerase FkpA
MKFILSTLAAALLSSAACAADMTDDQKTVYALGANIGKQIGAFNLSPSELELVKKGLSDAVLNAKLAVPLEE